jgi:ribosomal protein S18 acetylase RimI-like enzyme
MKITKAALSDAGKLADMNKRLIEDEHHPNPMNLEQLTQRMSAWLQNEYTSYLAIEDGSIVAYCLFRDDGEYYYMRQLYVERENRCNQIATRLLDWMYRNVWTDKKVRLDVLSHNDEAIAFYKYYGFQIHVLRMEK